MTTEDTTPAGTEPAEDDTTPAGTEPAEDDTTPAGTEPAEPAEDPAGTEPAEDDEDEDEDGDTFPRAYVKRLRERSAGYRARAKDAEARTAELERALFTERVRALDVLADPSDLPVDADLLEDPDALRAAADDLVARRPHYRRRGAAAGAGSREEAGSGPGVALLGLMRGGARGSIRAWTAERSSDSRPGARRSRNN